MSSASGSLSNSSLFMRLSKECPQKCVMYQHLFSAAKLTNPAILNCRSGLTIVLAFSLVFYMKGAQIDILLARKIGGSGVGTGGLPCLLEYPRNVQARARGLGVDHKTIEILCFIDLLGLISLIGSTRLNIAPVHSRDSRGIYSRVRGQDPPSLDISHPHTDPIIIESGILPIFEPWCIRDNTGHGARITLLKIRRYETLALDTKPG